MTENKDPQGNARPFRDRPGTTGNGGEGRMVDDSDLNDLGLDDDTSIPTYESGPGDKGDATGNLYTRTGRAAPQNIEPTKAPKATPPEDTGTASFERPTPTQDHSSPLASDAPTSARDNDATTVTPRPFSQDYDDSDFAPQPGEAAHTYEPTMVQPAPQAAPQPTATAVPVEEQQVSEPVVEARRGTLDFGLFIIRAVVGAYLIARSVATFFGLGGSTGLAGLESEYAAYQIPEVLSILIPSLELAAGVFLFLGLMTPIAAAVATVATSFTALHQLAIHDGGWAVLSDSIILAVLLTAVVIGLQFTGPGRVSLDAGRGWARRPLASSWIFVLVGIAAAVVLWWFGAGLNPLSDAALPQPVQ